MKLRFVSKIKWSNEKKYYKIIRRGVSSLVKTGLLNKDFFSAYVSRNTSFLIAEYLFARKVSTRVFGFLVLIFYTFFILGFVFSFFIPKIGFSIILLFPDFLYDKIYDFLVSLPVVKQNEFYKIYFNYFLTTYLICLFFIFASVSACFFAMFREGSYLLRRQYYQQRANSFAFKMKYTLFRRKFFGLFTFTLILAGLFYAIYLQSSLINFVYVGEMNSILFKNPFYAIFFMFTIPLLFVLLILLFFILGITSEIVPKCIHAEGYFLHEILRLILSLDEQWNSLFLTTKTKAGRHKLAYELQKLIPLIKKNLDIKSNDPLESHLNEKIKNNATNKIKEIKTWVYSPKLDTDIYIQKELIYILENIASGNIDYFLNSTPNLSENITTRQSISFYANRILLVIVKAIIPFTIVLLVDTLPFINLDSVLHDYLILGASIFAIVIILAELDPNIEERVKFLQEIILNYTKK